MIINYNIPATSFVRSMVVIDDISRPYWVEDEENHVYDVYYAFSGRAIDHVEFTVDTNINLYTKGAMIDVVSLYRMGENYFAFHLNSPWYRYIGELGEPSTMVLRFNGSIFTDNPYNTKPFNFKIEIEGCK